MPEPNAPVIGFGMNVAYTPLSAATSLLMSRNVITLSAIVSASVWRRSISCCDGPFSWNEYSTGMPIASRRSTVCLRSCEPRSCAVSWK